MQRDIKRLKDPFKCTTVVLRLGRLRLNGRLLPAGWGGDRVSMSGWEWQRRPGGSMHEEDEISTPSLVYFSMQTVRFVVFFSYFLQLSFRF